MFNRPDRTYNYSPDLINKILKKSNHPLKVITDLIEDNTTVLDIGAGNGILTELLRFKYSNVIIDGIEKNRYGGNISRSKYRNFYQGDAQNFFNIFQNEQYDYIVLADIIEHLTDPYTLLKKLVNSIPVSTKIILTTPNISFGAVRISLLHGDFDYTDSGILERTHLRFFNIKSLKLMLKKLDVYTELIINLQRNYLKSEINLRKYKFEFVNFLKLKKDVYSSTYQFLVLLNKRKVDCQEIFRGQSTNLKDYLSFRLKALRIF
ncbi:MAG: class I SAM-dependent methyltransferase [bacterium]